MLQKIRTSLKEKKGFTLVELVVVLVILAILAALLVPSLTGYIDKAKEKRVVAEVHQVVTAAQTLADEAYAMESGSLSKGTYDGFTIEEIEALSEIKGELKDVKVQVDAGKVVYVEVELSGDFGYYTGEEIVVNPEKAPTVPDATENNYVQIESSTLPTD